MVTGVNLVASMRNLFRPVYRRIFASRVAERRKAAMRAEAMSAPLGEKYPFDAEVKLLRSLGIPLGPMLDIGGNTGTYAILFEDLVGPTRLHIFEPLPALSADLRSLFPRSHVHNVALSDSEGTRLIRRPFVSGVRLDTRATLNDHREPGETACDTVPIMTARLDDIVDRLGLADIRFMKIDVEGHEREVIRGGSRTITRFCPIMLVEIEARHHSAPIETVFAEIRGLGYEGFFLDVDSRSLVPLERFETERHQRLADLVGGNVHRYVNNFLFADTARAAEFAVACRAALASGI